MKKVVITLGVTALGGIIAALVAVFGLILLVTDPTITQEEAATACVSGGSGGSVVPAHELLTTQVGRFDSSQLANAARIVAAGADLKVPVHGQTIAVMTAIGESSLIDVDHGDTVGPDSRGLFQQRANGAWGSYAERMDPTTAAQSFYRSLLQVQGWQTLPPTIAAHRVQINADPYHYAPYWQDAVRIVEAVAGDEAGMLAATTPTLDSSGMDGPCSTAAAAGDASVTADGWTNPAVGRSTSPFGVRVHPITGAVHTHTGEDVANVCGTPVKAAADGVVIRAAPGPFQGRTGNQIIIDHGGGVTTRYGHVLTGTMSVHPGDQVTAGQQVAAIGGDRSLDPIGAGGSTGCHLHFEVNVDGQAINSRTYLNSRGITLGTG